MPFVCYDKPDSAGYAETGDWPSPTLSEFEFVPAHAMCRATDAVRFNEFGELTSEPNATLRGRAERYQPGSRSQSQNRFALLIPCMRDIGLEKIYCRIDGGPDDGFSWVSHAHLKGGQQVEPDALCDMLAESGAFTNELRALLGWESDVRSKTMVVRDTLDVDLCSLTWGPWLFGHGFGRGLFRVYGAYVVDLVQGTIEEDTDADPVVQNITIAFS
ncbi:MAG: hypothetical protein AAF346_07475 [Pseudomonadota bacterium]